ncbi:MAG: PKD domain-containing protein, partial [Bacteroidota bacterium]
NYSYAWTVPVGVTDPGNVDSFTTTTAGTYSVQVTDVTTGCISTTAGSVTINPLPTVSVNSPSVCPGVDATIIATPSPTGTYSYSWVVPAGATPPGNVSTFATSVLGTYSVIITDLATTCQSEIASGVVIASPVPTVTVNDTSICSGNTATVIATPAEGSATDYTYQWTVPSGVTDPGNVSSFGTTVAGLYGVVITNISTTCVSLIDFGTVVINPSPTVTVNSPSVCAGTDASVTATPGLPGTYNYSWTVPTGATDPGNVSTFLTSIPGTYSVVITDTTTNCPSASASGTVTVSPLPTASVSSSGTVCSGSSATILFTGTPNSIVTYTINNGANATINIGSSGVENLTIPLVVTSTFTLVSVTLANPPSCSQTLSGSTTLNVTQPPVAGSNAAISFCSNGSSQDLFAL